MTVHPSCNTEASGLEKYRAWSCLCLQYNTFNGQRADSGSYYRSLPAGANPTFRLAPPQNFQPGPSAYPTTQHTLTRTYYQPGNPIQSQNAMPRGYAPPGIQSQGRGTQMQGGEAQQYRSQGRPRKQPDLPRLVPPSQGKHSEATRLLTLPCVSTLQESSDLGTWETLTCKSSSTSRIQNCRL